MPKTHPVDERFFTTAPVRATDTFAIARPAAEVWGELTSDRPLHWCRGLDATWTSPRPFAVGAKRRVKILGGVLAVDEHYFIWEEGRRHAFYVESCNLPMFKRLAEDYVVEPDGPDACRFTWTAALEPTALGKLGGPVNALLFKSLFADTRRYFGAR